MKNTKFYSAEIKREAIDMKLKGVSTAEIAEKFNILSISTINKWVRAYKNNEHYKIDYVPGKTYIPKEYVKYENSFAYHIEEELNEPIEKYWDFKKNKVSPYGLYKNSLEKVWIKCNKKSYHNSYLIDCHNFTNGRRCSYCSSKKINYFDSLGFKYFQLAKLIVEDENRNKVTLSDTYSLAPSSHKKYYFQCPVCKKKSSSPKRLDKVTKKGFGCEWCGDGISIPEKFVANLLQALNIRYLRQISKSTFKWCDKYRYDFYLIDYNLIIEVHGPQHFEERREFIKTLAEQQDIDNKKKELAESNNVDYMFLDCRESTLSWLKENCRKKLDVFFDLSGIDFIEIYRISCISLIYKVAILWNDGKDIPKICLELNLSRSTVTKYLKKTKDIGITNYDAIEEMRKSGRRMGKKKNKKVRCETTEKEFKSIIEASNYYFIERTGIINCCKGRANSAGKHYITGEALLWTYVD